MTFVEDVTSTSVVPQLPQCLHEEQEEKESDSDSEGPIQYRDEEDEDESQQSKKRKDKQEKILLQEKLFSCLSKCRMNGNKHPLPGVSRPIHCLPL